MTPVELIRDLRAEYEARRQYDRAVERHFIEAHRLVIEGKPDRAEAVAKAAAILRERPGVPKVARCPQGASTSSHRRWQSLMAGRPRRGEGGDEPDCRESTR